MSIQKDVTEELKIKKQSEQLTLLHSVWREVASAGLNLGPLRQRVAEEALRLTNAEAAAVEEPDGSEMIYRAAVGGASGQEGLRLPINRSLSGRCYSSRITMVCEDAETDPWINTEAARAVGLRSGIVAPLVHQGGCYGVLKVYSSRPYHFSQNDVQLLDLSSGILAATLFDAAAFEEEIRKRQSILDATPILMGYVDQGRRYVEVNSAHEKLFQQPLLEIRGKPLWDVIPEETYNELGPYLTAALSGESVSFEIDLEVRGKRSRRFRGNLEPHVGLNGDIGGCYVALLDVTDARLADTDYLTGLPNRRHFDERLADFTIQTRERTGDALSMLLLDIDHFKEVTDLHGHAAGDEVLKQFGAIISESCRKTDVPCRWGGEEFAILLDQCRGDEARNFAERLIEKIRGQSFEGVGNVTASIGVAEANETDTLQSLQGRADRALLYVSKHSGRNRVTHGSPGARPDARPGSAPD